MAAHKSQYVWFRKLYMIFSRYTFINTLQEVNALDLELDLQFDDWKNKLQRLNNTFFFKLYRPLKCGINAIVHSQ